MLRVFALTVVVAALHSPASACADEPRPISRATWAVEDSPRAEVRSLVHAGTALTVSGLGTLGGGLAWFLVPSGFEDYSGLIGGGTFIGLGGLMLLSGVPVWLVGAVRQSIAESRDPGGTAQAWTIAGSVVFAAGMITALVGGGLLWSVIEDRYANERLSISALCMIPIGSAIALFVGAPMLGEGLRF